MCLLVAVVLAVLGNKPAAEAQQLAKIYVHLPMPVYYAIGGTAAFAIAIAAVTSTKGWRSNLRRAWPRPEAVKSPADYPLIAALAFCVLSVAALAGSALYVVLAIAAADLLEFVKRESINGPVAYLDALVDALRSVAFLRVCATSKKSAAAWLYVAAVLAIVCVLETAKLRSFDWLDGIFALAALLCSVHGRLHEKDVSLA